MAKATKSKKKPIDQYDHKGKKRVNNPPVGLVTPETDKKWGQSALGSTYDFYQLKKQIQNPG